MADTTQLASLCKWEKCPLMEARSYIRGAREILQNFYILKVDECRRGILVLQLTPPPNVPSTSRELKKALENGDESLCLYTSIYK